MLFGRLRNSQWRSGYSSVSNQGENTMKKLFSIVAILSLVISPAVPAFATEITTTGSQANDFGGTGIWIQGLAGQADQRENKDYKAFQDNLMDYTVGFDRIMSPHVRLGGNFGYGYSNKNYKQNRTGFGSYGVNDHAFTTALTATYDSINLCESRDKGKYSPEAVRNQGIDGWYVDSALAFTQHNYDLRTERFDFSPAMEVGKSDYHGQEYTVGMEAGYIFNFGEENLTHVTPYTSLDYGYLYRNLSKVKGFGANDYKVKGRARPTLSRGLVFSWQGPLFLKNWGPSSLMSRVNGWSLISATFKVRIVRGTALLLARASSSQ